MIRLREVASFAELKELRLRVMELETQTQLALNQLKRQTSLVNSLNEDLETKNKQIKEQQVNNNLLPTVLRDAMMHD